MAHKGTLAVRSAVGGRRLAVGGRRSAVGAWCSARGGRGSRSTLGARRGVDIVRNTVVAQRMREWQQSLRPTSLLRACPALSGSLASATADGVSDRGRRAGGCHTGVAVRERGARSEERGVRAGAGGCGRVRTWFTLYHTARAPITLSCGVDFELIASQTARRRVPSHEIAQIQLCLIRPPRPTRHPLSAASRAAPPPLRSSEPPPPHLR